jgi:hypothetical protein
MGKTYEYTISDIPKHKHHKIRMRIFSLHKHTKALLTYVAVIIQISVVNLSSGIKKMVSFQKLKTGGQYLSFSIYHHALK